MLPDYSVTYVPGLYLQQYHNPYQGGEPARRQWCEEAVTG